MKIKLGVLVTFLFTFCCPYALAVNVGNITEIMGPDRNFLSKEVINTVGEARLLGLSVEKISSPMNGGALIPMSNAREIMSTPSSVILPGNGKDIFRIFYNGPKDDKERYYHLVWNDTPVGEDGNTKSKKSASATTSATISTILVVSPRDENFQYKYSNGIVSNYGNSTFRVVASGPCLKNEAGKEVRTCKERYFVMPGLAVRLRFIDVESNKSSIGIWHDQNFVVIK